jgi:hypothetical protein
MIAAALLDADIHRTTTDSLIRVNNPRRLPRAPEKKHRRVACRSELTSSIRGRKAQTFRMTRFRSESS